MRRSIHPLVLSMFVILAGCGPRAEESAMKTKCESLMKQRATTNTVIETFGATPKYTYSRSQAVKYFQRQGGEFWQRLSQYPLTYSFPIHSGDVLVYFDDSGTAIAYYLNIQL
jgi:hypothetical protein